MPIKKKATPGAICGSPLHSSFPHELHSKKTAAAANQMAGEWGGV